MSLNQMAWAMWERLDYKGMDPSVLSRLISGDRVFTSRQLDIFCSLLTVDEIERAGLYELLHVDLLGKFGWNTSQISPKDKYLLDLTQDSLVRVEQIAAKDLPTLASESIDQLYDRIHQLLPHLVNDATRQKMLSILSQLLILRKRVEFSLADRDNLPEKILDLPRELAFIANENHDSEALGNSYSIAGNIDFYKKNYKASMLSQQKAIPLIASNIEKATALARLAITYGKLGKEDKFLDTRKYMYDLLPTFDADFQCYVLQMISQGEIHSRYFNSAKKTLARCWNLYHQKVESSKIYSSMRRVQLVRTELELANASNDKKNKNYYEKIMKRAQELIKQHGYISFSPDIARFGAKLL